MALPPNHDKPVYPQPLPERGQSEQRRPGLRGITLLDHFAALALPVAQAQLSGVEITSNHPPHTYHGTPEEVAALAYDIAEALLIERNKRMKTPETTPAA